MTETLRALCGAPSIVLTTLTFALGACATPIEGSPAPPRGWTRAVVGESCETLAGSYTDAGEPAAENAHSWLYNVVWPVTGSLSSIIERGANAPVQETPSVVTILVNASADIAFEARTTQGALYPLNPKPWLCEAGTLTRRTPLEPATVPHSSTGKYREAYLRLWKAGDGALIAEQTIRAVKPGDSPSSANDHALARFYFRFEPPR